MMITRTQKINGELAVRNMSKKAQWFYDRTDPVTVWSVGGKLHFDIFGDEETAYTPKEMEGFLECMADECGYDEF